MATFCPITGYKVYSCPEWINRKMSDTFIANFWIIGDSIIYSLPKGRADLEGVKNSVALKAEITKQISGENGAYIQIQDYAALIGSTHEARSYFIKNANEDRQLQSMIFCNLSSPLAIAVKIGQRFNTSGKIIHISRHYKDAIKLASKCLHQQNSILENIDLNFQGYFNGNKRSLTPVELISGDDYNIATPGYSNRMMVIDQNILYSISEGYFEEKHVPLIESKRSLCHSAISEGSRFDYIVVDSSKLTGVSHRARIKYMKSLKDWHQKYPIKMFITHGGGTFMRTALSLASSLMPFRVKFGRDSSHVFRLIRDDSSMNISQNYELSKVETLADVTEKDIEKLLAFIGSINWEQDGIGNSYDVGEEHPLYFLFQAIKLIKEELDDLFTERKQKEEAIRRNEEQLARSKKMESLGLLAGGVAHDLNNILSGIVSYPELILMDLPEDSKLRKPIEKIQESGNRAVAIVDDLLTMARGVASIKEALNFNVIIKDYLNSPEFKKLEHFHPNVSVKADLDNSILNVKGSPTHFRKVVMNLVSNAVEAIKGAGNVIISAENHYSDRQIKGYEIIPIGEYVVFTVTDDGSGIKADDLERIFEPFYTRKVMGRSGTGLGLAVVWNVVKDNNGYIDVISNEKGTTFKLYFPICRDEVHDKILPVSMKDYMGKEETILIVDDEEIQREISCKIMETLNYKTIAVSSGEEAIEYLREHAVNLIMLDMIMDPGISGRETYKRIKEIHPDQKTVIVSGFAETEEVKEAQRMGAGQYIKKPLTMEKVGLVVKDELEK